MLGRAETSDRQRGSVSLRSACRGILRASSLLLSSSARDTPAHHPSPADLPRFHASFSSPSSSSSLEIPSSLTSQHRLDILSALLHGTRSTAPVRATHARRLEPRGREGLFLFNHNTSTSWVETHRVLGAIILLVVLLVPMSCASKSLSERAWWERLGYKNRLMATR